MACTAADFSLQQPANRAYFLATGGCLLAASIFNIYMKSVGKTLTTPMKLACAAIVLAPPSIRLTQIALGKKAATTLPAPDPVPSGPVRDPQPMPTMGALVKVDQALINWQNIGKFPPRIWKAIPDTPGHPAVVELVPLIKQMWDRGPVLAKAREIVERCQMKTETQGGKAEIKAVTQLILLIRHNPGIDFKASLEQGLLDGEPGVALGTARAMHELDEPVLPDGNRIDPERVLTQFRTYLEAELEPSTYADLYSKLLNGVGDTRANSDPMRQARKSLQYLVVFLEREDIPKERKQGVLVGLAQKFGSCRPTLVNEARRAVEAIYTPVESGENLILRLAKGVREEITVHVAQVLHGSRQWHTINMMRRDLGREFGLDPQDIDGDAHIRCGNIGVSRDQLLAECKELYTPHRLITGVQAQLEMMGSVPDSVLTLFQDAILTRPELVAEICSKGEDLELTDQDDFVFEPEIMDIMDELYYLPSTGRVGDGKMLNERGVAVLLSHPALSLVDLRLSGGA